MHQNQKDDIVDLIGLLNVKKRKEIFEEFSADDAASIKVLLGYKPDTAGGIMTTEYITLNKKMTLEDAYLKVCNIAPELEVIEELYVIDDANHLIGKMNIRDLLVPNRKTLIADIYSNKIVSVLPELDQEDVSRIVSKYDLIAIPVVNCDNVVIGVITLDDVISVIYQEQSEDFLNLGGVSNSSAVQTDTIPSIRQRLPWLLVNLGTVFFAAYVVSIFGNEIEKFVVLAMAMPVIAGMGGTSGNQVLAITIRNLTLDDIDSESILRKILKEVIIALINGMLLGGGS